MPDYAFPHYNQASIDYGLTKREYYAAMALQSILARANTDTDTILVLCKMAFAFADMMIKVGKDE